MRVLYIIAAVLLALSLAACDGGREEADIPAQSFQNALSALNSGTGELAGQILFPSEYAQHSIRFTLDGLTFVTHPDGRFRIQRVPEGKRKLLVRIKGYEAVEVPVEISADSEVSLPPFKLTAARGMVLGRLVKDQGGSAAGITVHLVPDGGVAVTDNEGIFQFLGIGAGPHTVMIKDPLYFTGNRHFELGSNQKRNLGNIRVFRQKRLDTQTARLRKR